IRYETKLDVIGGLDPYDSSLKWSTDVAILPSVTYPDIVNYLIFTPSRFKIDDLKAWKSLEAVNQFGWVREREAERKAATTMGKRIARWCCCCPLQLHGWSWRGVYSKPVTESKCWWIQPTATKAINYKEISEIDFTSKKSAARKVTSTSEMPENTPTIRKASFPKASYSD
ncbi:hypothetical protein MAR_033112, partial [Mya arenaria]